MKILKKENLYINRVLSDFSDKDLEALEIVDEELQRMADRADKIQFKKDDFEKIRYYYNNHLRKLLNPNGTVVPHIIQKIDLCFERIKSENVDYEFNCNAILLNDALNNYIILLREGNLMKGNFGFIGDGEPLPKLLIVSDEYFNEVAKKSSLGFELCVEDIKNQLNLGYRYVICVDSKSKVGRMTFHIFLGESNATVEAEPKITVFDHTAGIFSYVLVENHEEDNYRLCIDIPCPSKAFNELHCPYLQYGIEGEMDYLNCNYENCPSNRYQLAKSVLMVLSECLQPSKINDALAVLEKEEVHKKENLTEQRKDNSKLNDLKGIKVYDFYNRTELKKIGLDRKSLSLGSSKCPHVRRGGIRHLKNGKLVEFRATIVHKEKYRGFEVAHEIK